ncbi:MAG TPA: hypothetical protein DHW71_03345 [Gammaproteobacteria bacterium]|nr:hypothetical protein [Gammaproteobacteria bacterium]HBF08638.1 hypothetical protein [Gammaproteobacteria bacterium]HCK91993.1 hypothetical protein [Gammaproteobacteria bacterium]|tara:strand:- start:7441 stop:8190 length:750 start_codon:yes stop_codon:yes gene_type:complete
MNLFQKLFTSQKKRQPAKSLPEEAARIYSQLYGLKNARHFAWCRFGRDEVAYQSMIIDINVEERLLILDEPFGMPASFFWSPGMPIHVEIKDYETRISFKSRFVRLQPEESGDGNKMMIAWPAEVESHQRRSIFRVSFHEGDAVPMIQFMDISSDLLPCLDLSFQGVGVAVPDEISSQMYPGQNLVIQLWLPNLDPIVAKLHIKRLDHIEDLGVSSMGGVIEGIDAASKRVVDKFLLAAQRRELRSKVS